MNTKLSKDIKVAHKCMVRNSDDYTQKLRKGIKNLKSQAGTKNIRTKAKKYRQIMVWTKEEDQTIFNLYKEYGSAWSLMVKSFHGRTENQIKNRFYSTLRRVATKKMAHGEIDYKGSIQMKKEELLGFVDEALESGHQCFSKRGRKRKTLSPERSNSRIKIIQNGEPEEGLNPSKQSQQTTTIDNHAPSSTKYKVSELLTPLPPLSFETEPLSAFKPYVKPSMNSLIYSTNLSINNFSLANSCGLTLDQVTAMNELVLKCLPYLNKFPIV